MSNRTSFVGVMALIGLLTASQAMAIDGLNEGKPSRPAGARITLKLDREEYLLGENILAHLCVENGGAEPFMVSSGGDYRGAPRPMRFRVTATAADGTAVLDPYPNAQHMGGSAGGAELKPGERWEGSVQLLHYVHLPGPGEYVIRVSHDLGWQKGADGSLPTAEAKLRVRMPSEQDIEDLAQRMAEQRRDDDTLSGKRRGDFPDLSVMRYPIYLPLLQQSVAFGGEREQQEALQAMAHMPDEQAVRALLGGAHAARGTAAVQLAQALAHHLPRIAAEQNQKERHFPHEFSWRPEFAADVRRLAAKLLAETDNRSISTGASLLLRVGEEEDLDVIIRRLDELMPRIESARRIDDIFARERDAASMLRRAAHEVIERGGSRPSDPQTPGEILLYLPFLGDATSPADGQRVEGWLWHELSYIREAAVGAARMPLSEGIIERLPGLLEDPEINVRMAAAALVARAKIDSCHPQLLGRLAKAGSLWEIDAMTHALKETGGEVEAFKVMARRLHEPKLTQRLISNLSRVVESAGGSGWSGEVSLHEAGQIKAAWTKWLAEHEAELKRGKRFAPGDPALPQELFPSTFSVSTPSGDWPNRKRAN